VIIGRDGSAESVGRCWCTVPSSAPINVRARAVSSSTVVAQWDEPLVPNGIVRVSRSARRDALLCLPRRAASFMTNVQCPPDDARPRPYYHIAVHFYRFFCHRRIDGIVPMKGTEQQLVSAWNGLPTAPPAPRRPVTKTHSNIN